MVAAAACAVPATLLVEQITKRSAAPGCAFALPAPAKQQAEARLAALMGRRGRAVLAPCRQGLHPGVTAAPQARDGSYDLGDPTEAAE
jgi:hypothetical protein